jgi:phosphoglycerate dehydrogenase-like enzyme
MVNRKPRIMIVTSRGLVPEWCEEVSSKYASDAEFVFVPDSREDIYAAANDFDAIINCPRPFWSDELLAQLGPRFRWMHVGGAGIDEYLTPGFINSNVTFTNGKIIQGPEVADHAVCLLLAMTRRLNLILAGQSPRDIPRPIELRGKKAVIYGLGGIGMMVVERLTGFAVKMIGVNPDYVPMTHMLERVVPPEELLDVIGEADIVVCVAPNTAISNKEFGEREFRAMKSDAYFLNVSRGQLVDADALAKVMGEGHLAGAGLDVTDPEPLPDEHPLRSMDRVIITPHIAGLSEFNRGRSFTLITENIARFIEGHPLFNVVDKHLGY